MVLGTLLHASTDSYDRYLLKLEQDARLLLKAYAIEKKVLPAPVMQEYLGSLEHKRNLLDRQISAKKQKEKEERLAQKLKIEKEEARQAVEIKKALEKKLLKEKKAEELVAKVDVSQQRMKVYRGGKLLHTWKVSTGKKGHRTPKGNYKPGHMTKMHYSKKYNNAPMPYAVFFKGGYAIHGTKSVHRLGRTASHGCVRLRTSNAKKLYKLIRRAGKNNMHIKIVK